MSKRSYFCTEKQLERVTEYIQHEIVNFMLANDLNTLEFAKLVQYNSFSIYDIFSGKNKLFVNAIDELIRFSEVVYGDKFGFYNSVVRKAFNLKNKELSQKMLSANERRFINSYNDYDIKQKEIIQNRLKSAKHKGDFLKCLYLIAKIKPSNLKKLESLLQEML